MSQQYLVMICTAARGGMRSVVEGYRNDGVFERWNVLLISPHVEAGLLKRLATAALAMFQFFGLLIRRRVGLVHCHAAMKGSFWRKSLFALLARALGVPVIFHLHGSEMKTFVSRQPKIARRLIAWVLSRQSVVVVLSQSWADYVLSISPEARVQILPNYVSLPDLSTKYEPIANKVRLLFLGLVGTRKGVYDLLPAFQKAFGSCNGLELTIGGNGEVERAQALAQELGVAEHVCFAGWVSGDDKLRLLQEADIYVLPSYNEGLPVSILEAMSWGVPVISTRVGGIPELINQGQDGLLIDAGDCEGLAKAILQLAESASVRRAMGATARNRVVTGFSKAVVLPELESLYAGLTAGRPVLSHSR